jgi:uncharacterized membrane protein
MRKAAQLISWLSLILLVAAPVLFFAGVITLEANKILLNTTTGIWFASALCWMGREKEA